MMLRCLVLALYITAPVYYVPSVARAQVSMSPAQFSLLSVSSKLLGTKTTPIHIILLNI